MFAVRFSWLVAPSLILSAGLACTAVEETPAKPTASIPPVVLFDVSNEFVNAVVFRTIDRVAPVTDVILDAYITGKGRTRGFVSAEFVPCRDLAVVNLVVTGKTFLRSMAWSRPVALYGDSMLGFRACKPVFLNVKGVRSGPASAKAVVIGSYVWAMDTSLNEPLFDCLAKRVGYSTYLEQKAEGEAIAARHGEERIVEELDTEAEPQLQKLNEILTTGLRKTKCAAVAPEQIHLSTSWDALQVRVTPQTRGAMPIAPPPILGSTPYLALRLHESALNELFQTYLQGKTVPASELATLLTDLTGGPPAPKDEKRWTLTFAKEKPVSVVFDKNGIAVRMLATAFTLGDETHGGLEATVAYKFKKKGEGIHILRQGPVQVVPLGFKEGDKLSASEQAPFTMMQQRLNRLLNEELVLDPSQFPADLGSAGPLVVARVESARGWLLLTAAKRAGKGAVPPK